MILAAVLGNLTAWEVVLKIVLLIVGIVILVKGADFFVGASSSIAKKMHISPLVIGLTIVAFGTSAPELAVSLVSAITCEPGQTADIAMGNIVGSNIANIGLVLGLSALITPIAVKKGVCKKQFPFLIITSLLLLIFSFDVFLNGSASNQIVRAEGIVFVLLIVYFVISEIKDAKTKDPTEALEEEPEEIKEMSVPVSIILLLVGLAGIVLGAEFVTNGAKSLAINIGVAANVDESLMTTLVGLTVVALGTSLPELMTSLVAAKKGQNEIAIGNVIGSNIFNILFVVGLSSVITPLGINDSILYDSIIMMGITILLFVICLKGKISRKSGGILLGLYLIYIVYIVLRVFL